jgi:hypothetical protein
MNKPFLATALVVSTLLVGGSRMVGAQQTSQPDPYQGTSNPPPDDTIITSQPPAPVEGQPAKPSPSVYAKPPAAPPANGQQVQPTYGQPALRQPAQGQATYPERQPVAPSQFADAQGDGTDDGIVQVAPDPVQVRPALNQRNEPNDADGDIVHPAPLGPGQVGEGTTIRARLLDRLSTADSQNGDTFRARVATDVVQGGQVLIPAGSEIDGRVTSASSGRLGGHGSMHLSPETVILPDGSRFKMYAEVSGAPGSGTRVGSEGNINPGSQVKKDSIEYGGAVGAGAVTGAVVAGPAGALAGTLIGAGVITAHLLINHPQATLDSGTVLLFTLTERLNLVPVTAEAGPPALAQ